MFGVLLAKTLKNYVCVSIRKGGDIVVRVTINPDTIERKPGSAPDVRGKGCCGTGDLEILICSDAGLEWTIPLIL
ncbi:MAG: hypothetical protein WBK56_05135 [Methanoculleus sp.]